MLRSLVKDSAVYAVGTIASRLVGFIMIPIYTRVLTPADYGIIETIVRLVDVIGLFLALGLAEALLRHYYLAKDEQERRRLIATVFNLNLVVVIVGSLLTLPASPYLARLAFGHERYAHYVTISLISMLVGNLIELPLTLWRAEGKAWRFTTISLCRLSTQLATNIVLVVWLRWGVWGVVLSGLINASVWSFVLGVLVRLRYGGAFDMQWVKPVLRYGLPLVPASLSQFILHFSDRFFLTRYASESELGLYSLAYRFGMLVSVFYGIVSMAWAPWAFRVGAQEEGAYHLQRAISLILLGFALVASGIILFARPAIHLMSATRFWGAADYVPPLAGAYWFFVAQGPLSVGARLSNRTDALAGANILSALLCLLLSMWLIPLYRAWGAAWVTMASFIALASASYVVSQRYYRVGLSLGTMLVSILLMLAAAAVDLSMRHGGAWQLAGRLVAATMLLGVVFWQVRQRYSLPSVVALWRRSKQARAVTRMQQGM
ncbi:MAG: lipopolysaccharide biosynthesis protein [Armatimonadota bacterium]